MPRGDHGHRQVRIDDYTPAKSHCLHGDIALVVVEKDQAIEFPLHGAHEYRVRRDRPDDIQASRGQRCNRRGDDRALFITEQAPFAAMRIKGRHGQAWLLSTGRQIIEAQDDDSESVRRCYDLGSVQPLGDLSERHMPRHRGPIERTPFDHGHDARDVRQVSE